jgi:hypothetical protein
MNAWRTPILSFSAVGAVSRHSLFRFLPTWVFINQARMIMRKKDPVSVIDTFFVCHFPLRNIDPLGRGNGTHHLLTNRKIRSSDDPSTMYFDWTIWEAVFWGAVEYSLIGLTVSKNVCVFLIPRPYLLQPSATNQAPDTNAANFRDACALNICMFPEAILRNKKLIQVGVGKWPQANIAIGTGKEL